MERPKLHHVGIIVPSMEQVQVLLGLLGLEAEGTHYVSKYEADCVFTAGVGTAIEFIVPRGGKLAKFNKGVGGLHHIALEVDDLDRYAASLRDKDIVLLEQEAVDAGRMRINFLPPNYTRGLIVEFVEMKK